MSDQEWLDKFAIQELIYSHCDAITRGDLSAGIALRTRPDLGAHSLVRVAY